MNQDHRQIPAEEIDVRTLGPHEWRDALRMIRRPVSESALNEALDEFTGIARSESGTGSELVGGMIGGKLVAAMPATYLPAETVLLGAPCGDPEISRDRAARLLRVTGDRLLHEGAEILQLLLEHQGGPLAEAARAAGFQYISDLKYLFKSIASERTANEGRSCFVEFAGDIGRLSRIVEATYAGSADFPELNGRRRASDALASYRASGAYRPDWWFIARHGDADVGCLILCDHPKERQIELVYMGLVPEARGTRLGQALLEQTDIIAGRNARERVILAVDQRNGPALRRYEQAGYMSWASRSVFLRMGDSFA